MMEAGVLIDLLGEPIHWHLPPGRSGGSLPDSLDLWEVIWLHRKNISGFAHSHPGFGPPSPSYTDVTTFAAIEAALGRRLDWWICTSSNYRLFRWVGPDPLTYQEPAEYTTNVPWLNRLREVSNYRNSWGDRAAKDGSGTPNQVAAMATSMREVEDERILEEMTKEEAES